MKRITWPLFIALCAAVVITIPASSNATQPNGAVCNSACVTKVHGVATCDPECTARSGHCIFVDNQGDLTKVTDRKDCRGYTHKPVKTAAVPQETEQQRERDLRIQELYNNAP